jgi:hypothetical protein
MLITDWGLAQGLLLFDWSLCNERLLCTVYALVARGQSKVCVLFGEPLRVRYLSSALISSHYTNVLNATPCLAGNVFAGLTLMFYVR